MAEPTNGEIASHLREIADLLEAKGEGEYRIAAYRRGADRIESEKKPLTERLREEGREGVESISGIGRSLGGVIAEYVDRGTSSTVENLRAEVDPERLFSELPGVGEELAQKIVGELDIHSLEDLEQAAHDGRLEGVEGFGPARVEGVREILDSRLRRGPRIAAGGAGERPPRELLLKVDAEYREKAADDELPRIAPRRFNPEGERWLPLMRTKREGWELTALFSNTARAHREGKTRDWVVIYWKKGEVSGQNTVVTAEGGARQGERVVAGR
jgi:hypothetical protein